MRLPIHPESQQGTDGPDDTAPVSGQLLSALLDEVHLQVKAALLYTHHRADRNTEVLADLASTFQAVTAMLIKQGVIDADQLAKQRGEIEKRIKQQFTEKGMGAICLVPEIDKYTFKSDCKVDCSKRLHICRAACCRMPFALSKQDIKENVIQWNLGHPYVIQHGHDGFCVHRDAGSCHCTAYEHRPVACRAYDCTGDERIWSDFDAMKLTPELVAIYAEQDRQAAGGMAD